MIKELEKLGVSGFIKTKILNNLLLLQGKVFVKESPENFKKIFKEIIEEKYPNMLYSYDIDINKEGLIIDEEDTLKKPELDEVSIVYQGMLPVEYIEPYHPFKMMYEENYLKVRNVVKIIRFIAPIILDKNLRIIDGQLRLRAAIDNDIKEVPVVIVDANDTRADFLRLALNRSSEFQRWEYRNVDEYVDNTPQAQPLLEPLGFFGEKLLPTSFFSETMVDYKINPFSEIQRGYSQEEGLLEWAEYRREQMAKKHEEMYKKRKKKTPTTKSLFDLIPKEEDFIETYDVEEFSEKILGELRTEAERLTQFYDDKKGDMTQNTRMSSKEKAEHDRNQYLSTIQEKYNLDNDEIEQIKKDTENIMDFDEVQNIIDSYINSKSEGEYDE